MDPRRGRSVPLRRASLQWALTAEKLQDLAAAEGVSAWVMDIDDHLAGHLHLTWPSTSTRVRLSHVLIDPTRRGQGLGRQLLSAALVGARRAGAEYAELSVVAHNQVARQLYTSLNFLRIGPSQYEEQDDLLTMARAL